LMVVVVVVVVVVVAAAAVAVATATATLDTGSKYDSCEYQCKCCTAFSSVMLSSFYSQLTSRVNSVRY
jgi:hypothetical protein